MKKRIEMFPCAGGMAEGFRRAGITFDIAIEFMPDHCSSYEQNLGHRPICMDARDFLRLLREGMKIECELLVADPPCTPWSHAGKRQGTKDDRDMLVDTCEIISILQPDAYLIGNVPGLDDHKNLSIVQEHIGGLSRHGYCTADFIKLDAADYGVPQRRIRPFWFGHKRGACIQWPAPTHGGPDVVADDQPQLPGIAPLRKWITCWDALRHLPADEIGRPVKVKRMPHPDTREMFAPSDADTPAKTVTAQEGSRYLTGGSEMFAPSSPDEPAKTLRAAGRTAYITVNDTNHAMSDARKPGRTITRNTHGDGSVIVFNAKHPNMRPDQPAMTLGAKQRGQGANVLTLNEKHMPAAADAPASTLRGGGNGHSAPQLVIMAPGNHAGSAHDEPAKAVLAGDGGGSRRLLEVPQGLRVGDPSKPSAAVTAKAPRKGTGENHVMEWPWKARPATTVQADERLSPPGYHDEDFATRSLPNAVMISEKAGAILQGFPETWVFVGKTKKARWSQIGQAMPPGLAHPVAMSVAKQMGITSPAPLADVVPIGKAKRKRRST